MPETLKRANVKVKVNGQFQDVGLLQSDVATQLASEIATRQSNDNSLEANKIPYPLNPHSKYGNPGDILRTDGAGGTKWVPAGLPTDEQTQDAINNWLDAHPEATTTVQDGSLTEAKFTDALKLKAIKDYVTPEMFGAKGDGVTDDTIAIQNAVNSGLDVIFQNKTYKTSTINIGNCKIDCNGASFVVKTGSQYLFYGAGSSGNEASAVTVIQGQNIDIGNDYTGVGIIYSDDNLLQTRDYFTSGFMTEFLNGKSINPSLFGLTNTVFYSVNPICTEIKNISNVTFETTNDQSYIAYIEYGLNCKFENIHSNGKLFCGFWIQRCVNTIFSKCNIYMTETTISDLGYSYGISISECANTIIKECYIFNHYWHAVTTSGKTNSIFCYNTIINNCILLTDSIALAFLDHDNAFFTQIKNSVVQSLCISAGGSVVDCIILAQSGSNHNCRLQFQCVAIQGYKYVARNIQFIESPNTNIVGFTCVVHGNNTGKTYYANILIENAKNTQNTKQIAFSPAITDGLMNLESVVIRDMAVNIRDITADYMQLENVGFHKNGDCSTIGTNKSGKECAIAICKINNSNITNLYITGRAYLTNCDSNGVNMQTSNATVFMVNCRVSLPNSAWRTGHWQGTNLFIGGYTIPWSAYVINGTAYWYKPTASGFEVSQI